MTNKDFIYRSGKKVQKGDHLEAKKVLKNYPKRIGNFGSYNLKRNIDPEKIVNEFDVDDLHYIVYKQVCMSLYLNSEPMLSPEREELWATYERV